MRFAVAIDTRVAYGGFVVIRAARIDFEDKKVLGNLSAFNNACGQKLFPMMYPRKPLTKRMANRGKWQAGR